jgi:hypothetical protein
VNNNAWKEALACAFLVLAVVGSLVLVDVNCQYQKRMNHAAGVKE